MSNTSLRYIPTGTISHYEVDVDARDGTAQVTWQYESNTGTTFDHYHGHVHTLNLIDPEDPASHPDADEVDVYLASDDTRALLERVRAGYSSDWNGHNMIGALDDDATDALASLQSGLYALRGLPAEAGAWAASDWLGGSRRETIAALGLTANTTDAEIETMARRLVEEAEREMVVIDARETEYLLRDWRDELPETADAA